MRNLLSNAVKYSPVRGRIGGTGIGLLTARQIVEEYGGTSTVESRENVGSLRQPAWLGAGGGE